MSRFYIDRQRTLFKNELVTILCKKMSISKKYSSSYAQHRNGLVERTNKTLLAIIAKTVYENKARWDEHIDLIRFNYNIRWQENLKCSPFELLYGRSPELSGFTNKSEKEETTMQRIKRINDLQKEVMLSKREKQAKKIKVIKNEERIKIGDVVLYKKAA